jgi:ABC-2 type transport system ATP-binding protein
MIKITGLTKSYGPHRVLDSLDMRVRPGEVTLLVGANGCGKTTTLRLLCGLSAPDAGTVVIGKSDLAVSRMAALAQLSFLPQAPRFHARLTAGEILAFYARLRGLPASRVGIVEAQWNLAGVRAQSTGRLSGGTRQRLALAVLSLPDAPVLVLDEPGLSLDPHWRRLLQAELRAAARRGATVLVATHLLGEWNGHADRCLVLERGRIEQELPPARLLDAFPFARLDDGLAHAG